MSQLMKKRFPSIQSIDVGSDGNTSFLRAARNGQLDKVLEHLKSNIDINTSNANGLNALHLASKDGHIEIVKELLKRGALVDAATKKGNTALHIASLAGQEEVVKLLVQNGASVNVQSQNGFTPLYMAAQENHDNVVRYLLANGANQSLSTEDGFTPLAVAMQQGHDKVVTVLLENDTRGKVRLPALHIAAKKDDVKAAKLLLENEHNPDVTSKSGFTPLHIASHYGNQQIAVLLIEKGADVNYAAKHNITPLHVAAKWGKSNMVALLLENGATIDAKTRDGLTPLHCAARSGHEQVVDMLLEKGAPISSKTKNGLAPLHMAAQGDHVDAARILLYHRAPVDEVTVDYLTALHVAAHCGHVRVAKLLLDRQADANARALNGFTPLHIACKKNRIKVVELLLKHGASIGATTESGLTPLHVASFMGCMNIVIYLLQHDANPDAPTVRGETPLHLAARANQTDIIRILLRNGAQVDARAREQQTPLHIASRLGNVDIAMLLLQHGAKVDNATKDLYTALHIAAKEGQDEVAAILIDNGASINATTKKGFTPLHLASKYGHLKVAKLLLQKEAPVDAQGKNGVTPLHVASHYDHQNVALLLLDKGASPHATAKNGHTPLHIAARKNQMDIANTLLEYGAQPNAESKAGFTPLHLSAQEGHVDMSSLLLEHKADANHEAKNGLAPLHLCAQEDRVPVAEVLVKNGAHVNAATKAGYTPLHIACHYGQTNMVRFLLKNKAQVQSSTSLGYTPLHQAAQQGHTNIVNILLENKADPNAVTTNGQTPLNIAQKLGYITVIETLKLVTTITNITTTTTTTIEEKYRVQAPEAMQETFMSDSEEEGGEDAALGDQTYRYLTADEMKSLGDDSLPIDVTRDERIDSNKISMDNMFPPQHIEDSFSPEHISNNYTEYIIKKYTPDNIDINRHPIHIGFLVSFLVDARGGAMRGCRHSGVRVIVPPRSAGSPTRITCRYVRPQRTPHPPPLMEGEALASRVLELGPVGAKFLGPVVIEVPHFAALRGKEREIVILRSDNGEAWKEHTVDAAEDILNEVMHESFEAEDLSQMEDVSSGRISRIVTQDFPQYFAVVSRIRQEVHAIGPEGGMVSSTVVPQVQAIFPEGALTKKIKVGLQAQPIDPELTAKLLGHGVAVSPVVTVEPRRRKFHKAIRLNMPAPTAHSQGMINQYSGSAPTLRLLCSITGGTTRAQWEDVTGSTPLTFVNDVVSFTTTVSARFWLMDCRNIGDATKMATELYKEAIHVPFMAKFVVFAKRIDPLEARLRVFCMTDDKEDKTLEHQEHFTEVAKSRDVEVLEGKSQFIEFAGNLVPITKSGDQLQFSFRAFRENRLPFSVRVKDQHAEAVGRCLFMRESKVPKGEPPQQPICILNIVLPDDIVTDTISLTDSESGKRHMYLSEFQDYYRPDPRLADMSNLLGEDWVELAHQLGLTSSEINVIKSEYPESIAKQAQSMLRMWLSQSGNKVQTNTLENALKRIGREDIIPQCLNVEQPAFARINKEEEIGYRLRKKDEPEKKKIIDHYDKYSAEEKAVKSESEEEDNFDRTVTERREQIEKRLSAERAIPASAQRREIVQEISDIKRQSLVEDKIAEVMQKADSEPSRQYLSETVEIKTTQPSDSTVPGKVQTTVVETHRIVEETSIRPGEDARFVEEVSSRFDGPRVRVEHRVSPTEDPRSPNFSKTPPPSPADFILQKQAATAQEWDASRKPAEPIAPIRKDAAQQGKPTSTAQYLASNEDMSLIDVGPERYDLKPVFEQTNAFILSESRAEPYHPHTQRHYVVKAEAVTSPDASREEKKPKRGFFGTLKGFVSRSSDFSDSDSERSPKKEKKKKKDKKKKSQSLDLPPQRPPRKPKLPTPVQDRKYEDIPYMEAGDEPPGYAPPAAPLSDSQIDLNGLPSVPSSPVLVLKEERSKTLDTRKSKSPTKEKRSKSLSREKLSKEDKSKTPKVRTVVVDEQVVKTFAPAAVEEEEFTIVIDPTKKASPKKSREIYTLNLDKSVDEIEKELLGKSPIMAEESIVKPIAHIHDAPVRPPRVKDHYYEPVEAPVMSRPPEHLISTPESLQPKEATKSVTVDLITSEMAVVEQPEQLQQPDSEKSKRKAKRRLFGKLSRSSKDTEDSEDDSSRREVIEKQDREESRERSLEPEEHKKGGLLGGIFTKKSKKELAAAPVVLSPEVVQNMKDSRDFLKLEINNYHDVKGEAQVQSPEKEKEKRSRRSKLKEARSKSKDRSKSRDKSRERSKSRDREGFLGRFKKPKKGAEKPELSDETLSNMQATTHFLNYEVNKYHDGPPRATTVPSSPGKDETDTKSPEKRTKPIPQARTKKAPAPPREPVDKAEVRETVITDDLQGRKITTVTQEKGDHGDKIVSVKKEMFIVDPRNMQGLDEDLKKKIQQAQLDAASPDRDKSEPFVRETFTVETRIIDRVIPIVSEKETVTETEITYDKSPETVVVDSYVANDQGIIINQQMAPKRPEGLEGARGLEEEQLIVVKPVLSDEVLFNMNHSDDFLKGEVANYHDVRPVVLKEKSKSPEKSKKGLLGLFAKSPEKKKRQKSLEKTPEEVVQEKESKGLFGMFKSPEKKPHVKHQLSEEVLNDMKDSDNFLIKEVEVYHDVRPIGSVEVPVEEPKETKGLFGLFKDRKRGKSVEKEVVKPVLSKQVIVDMKQSDDFLKKEVDLYHDVRPSIVEPLAPSEEKVHKDSKGLFGLFKSPEKQQKETPTPVLSKQVVEDMRKSDEFLKTEVDKYHDARPSQEVLGEPAAHKESKGIFGLFKSAEKEKKKKEKSVDKEVVKTTLSEQVLLDMKQSNDFLKQEVELFHDVRPVVEPVPVEEKAHKESKGLFGLFKSPEKEKRRKKEKSIEKEIVKPVLSQQVVADMKQSNDFLKQEVAKYHDVRPIVQHIEEAAPEKAHKESKGLFGLFKSPEKEKKQKKEKSVEKEIVKPILSQQVVADMEKSSDFLKQEVAKYHDVRPIVQPVEEVPPQIEEKAHKESKGLFGLFKSPEKEKKQKKEKSIEKEIVKPVLSQQVVADMKQSNDFLRQEVEVYHDVRPVEQYIEEAAPEKAHKESKGLFGLFKSPEKEKKQNKEKSVEKEIAKPILSQQVIADMEKSNDFLKQEVAKYYDVRPIVQPAEEVQPEIEEKVQKESKGLFGIFKSPEKEKRRKKEKSIEKEIAKPILSQQVIADMEKSNDFLKQEVAKYHDVRPIVQSTEEIQPQIEVKAHKESKGLFGLFRSPEKEKKQKKEKSVEREIAKPILSQQVIADMEKSNDFLKQEVAKYHDVRPIVQTTEEVQPLIEEKVHKESKGLFAIFKSPEKEKKQKKEKSVEKEIAKPSLSQQVITDMAKSKDFLKQEVAKYHDVRPIVQTTEEVEPLTEEKAHKEPKGLFGLFKSPDKEKKQKKEKSVEKEIAKPILSQQVVADMKHSNDFLKQEVEVYHDVRPIVKPLDQVEEKPHKESKGLFGLFKSPEKEKKKKEKSVDRETKPVLSEEIVAHMKQSDNFLKQEIQVYHDVRPLVQPPEPEEVKEETHKEHKGLFSIFKSPEKEKKKKEKSVEKEMTKPVLSDVVVEEMKQSNDFLKKEVQLYHDVRPIVRETTPKVEEQTHKEHKGLFSFLKSPEKSKKKKKEGSVEKAAVSEQVLKDMKESHDFLNKEVDIYHDVRPVVTKEATEKEIKKIKTTDESAEKRRSSEQARLERQDTDEFLKKEVIVFHDVRPITTEPDPVVEEKDVKDGGGFLGLFRPPKKDKKTGEKVILSESVLEHMKNSYDFLRNEVEVFHDVRPLNEEEHKKSKGLFGVFKSHDKKREGIVFPDDETTNDSIIIKEVEVYQEAAPAGEEPKAHSKGFLGMFKSGEKEKGREGSVEKPVLSEQVIREMRESNDFLKQEVGNYHDVRPVVHLPVDETKELKHKGLFGIFKSPKKRPSSVEKETLKPVISEKVLTEMKDSNDFLKQEVEVYHDVRPIVDQVVEPVQEKPQKKGLFIFKSPDKDKKKRGGSVERPVLSEEVLADMHNSNEFLKTEVEVYHDVRPLAETIALEQPPKEKKETKGILGMFKKQHSDSQEHPNKRLFKKTGEKRTSSVEKDRIPKLSEEVIADMLNSDNFLKTEVAEYHDVRPIAATIEEQETAEGFVKIDLISSAAEEVLSPESQKKESKGLFNKMFKKKKKTLDQEPARQPSEEAIKEMKDTTAFLQKEVDKFHDVRPAIDVEEKDLGTSTFYSVSTERIPETTNFLNNELDKYEDGVVKRLSTEDSIYIPPELSEAALLDMITSSNFLREEVSRFHDVRPSIKPLTEAKEEKHSKSGKLFGIFSKRKSQEREVSVDKESEKPKKDKKKKQKKPEDSVEKKKDNTLGTVLEPKATSKDDNKDFLQGEVDRYHDVRPVTDKPGGPFDERSKETKPTEGGSKPEVIDTAEVREVIWQDNLKGKKITTVTQEATDHGDKFISVTKEMHIVDPNIMKDVQELDDDIKRKIEQAKADADALDRDTSKPFIRENFSVETRMIDRSIPIEADKEVVTETEIIYENIPSTITRDIYTAAPTSKEAILDTDVFLQQEIASFHDVRPTVEPEEATEKSRRKKSGSPFKLFEKKHKSEDASSKPGEEDKENIPKTEAHKSKERKEKREKRRSSGFFSMFSKSEELPETERKPIHYSPEILKTLQDTTNFLTTEVTNYEDAKPLLVTDLDDLEVEEHTKSGLFSIFSKKRESPKITKKMFKKHKRDKSQESVDVTGKTYQKLEDLDEAVDKGIKELLDNGVQKVGEADMKVKQKRVAFSEDVEDQSSQLTNDIVSEAEKRVSALKDDTESLGALSKDSSSSFVNDILQSFDSKLEHVKEQAAAKGEAISETAAKEREAFVQKVNEKYRETEDLSRELRQESLDHDFLENERAFISDELKKEGGAVKLVVDDKVVLAKGLVTGVEAVAAETAKEVEDSKKKSAGFFTKLGDKLSGKAKSVERDVGETAQGAQVEVEKKVEDVLEDVETGAQEISEDLKESGKETKKGAGKFFSKLGDKLSGKSKHAADGIEDKVYDAQTSLETAEKHITEEIKSRKQLADDAAEVLDGQVSKVKDATDSLKSGLEAAAQDVDKTASTAARNVDDLAEDVKEGAKKAKKKSGSFLGKLGDKISGKAKETETAIADTEKAIAETGQQIASELGDAASKAKTATEEGVSSLPDDVKAFKDDAKKTAAEALDSQVSKTKDATDRLKSGLEAATQDVDKTASTTAQNVEDLAEDVKEEAKKAKKKSSSFLGKLGDKISGKAKETETAIADTQKAVGDAGQQIASELGDAASKVKTSTEEGVSSLHTDVKALKEDAKKNVGESQEELADGAKEAKKKAGGFFTKIGDKLSGKAKDAKEAGKQSLEDASSEVSSLTGTAAKEVEKAAEKLEEDVEQTIASVEAEISDRAKSVKENTEKVGGDVKDKSQSVADDASKAADQADKALKGVVDTTKDFTKTAADTLKSKSERALEKAHDVASEAKEAAIDAKDKLGKLGDKMSEKAKETDSAIAHTEKRAEKAVAETGQQIASELGDAASKAKTATEEGVSALYVEARAVKEDARQTVGEAQEELADGAKEAKKKAGGFFTKIGDKLSGKTKDAKEAGKQSLEDANAEVSAFAGSVEAKAAEVHDKTDEFLDAIKEVTKSAADHTAKDFAETEKAVIEESERLSHEAAKAAKGVKDDFESTKGEAAEKLQDLADETAEAKKKTGGFFNKLGDKISGKAKDADKLAKGVEHDVKQTGRDVKQKLAEGVKATDHKLQETVSASAAAVAGSKDFINKQEDALKEELVEAGKKIDETIGDIKKGASEAKKKSSSFLSKLGDKITGKAKEVEKGAETLQEDVAQKITATEAEVSDKAKSVKENSENITEELRDKSRGVTDDASKAADQVISSADKALKGAVDTTKDVTKTASDTLKSESERALEKADEAASEAKQAVIDAKDKSGSLFGKLGDKIAGKAKETEAAVADAEKSVENSGQQIASDLENAASKAKTATEKGVSSLHADVKTLEVDAKKNLGEAQDDLADGAKEAKKKAGGLFTKIGGKLSGKAKDVKETGKQSLEDAGAEIRAFTQAADDKADELLLAAKDGTKTVADQTAKDFAAAEKALIEETERLSHEGEKAAKSVKHGIEDTKDEAAEKLQDLADETAEAKKKTGGFFNKLGEKITGKGKETDKLAKAAEHDVKQIVKAGEEEIGRTSESLKGKGREALDGVEQKPTEALGTTDRKLEETLAAVSEAKDAISKQGDTVKKELLEAARQVDETSGGVKKDASEAKKKSGSFLSKVGGKITGKAKEVEKATEALQGDVADKITTAEAEISDRAKSVKENAEQIAGDLRDKSQSVADDAIKTVDTAKTTVDTLKSDAQKALEDVSNKADDAASETKEIATDVKKKSGSFLSKLGGKLSGKAKEVEKTVDSATEDVKQGLVTAGDFATDVAADAEGKIKDGIDAAKAKVDEDLKDARQDLDEAVKFADAKLQKGAGDTKEAVGRKTTEALLTADAAIESAKEQVKKGEEKLSKFGDKVVQSSDKAVEEAKEAKNKSESFVSKLGDKITGKAKESAKAVRDADQALAAEAESLKAEAGRVAESVRSVRFAEDATDLEDSVQKQARDLDSSIGKKGESLLHSTEEDVNKFVADAEEELKEAEGALEDEAKKAKKKSSSFLGKIVGKPKDEKDVEAKKEKSSFLGKLGDKITGKSKEVSKSVESDTEAAIEGLREAFHQHDDPHTKKKIAEISVKSAECLPGDDPSLLLDPHDKYSGYDRLHIGEIKQRTAEFLEAEASHIPLCQMSRTVSDYGGQIRDPEPSRSSITEANLDLSNLPADIDSTVSSAYVTSPLLPRRAVSQKYPKGERPDVVEIRNLSEYDIGDAAQYIVTEPSEVVKGKKPLFHIESEDDDSLGSGKKPSMDRSDSTRSNVLETLTEIEVDNLLSGLTKDLDDAIEGRPVAEVKRAGVQLQEQVKESEADVELIEQKLRDLDKALGSLEELERETDQSKKEKKLKRVERKFERMASELLEEEAVSGKAKQLSTPDVEEKRESEFQRLVSQISTEEVSDFQREYSHLWDEHTFSKSDDFESKTPDSQADAQELPKGEEAVHKAAPAPQGPSSSPKAESGEVPEKAEKDKPKKVSDQHQLSSEMKELLKEMERESKQ